MIEAVQIPALKCTCMLCGYQWLSTGQLPPENCGNPKCRSRRWNGQKSNPGVATIRLPRPAHRPRSITLLNDDDEL